jgi:hypothetical protein
MWKLLINILSNVFAHVSKIFKELMTRLRIMSLWVILTNCCSLIKTNFALTFTKSCLWEHISIANETFFQLSSFKLKWVIHPRINSWLPFGSSVEILAILCFNAFIACIILYIIFLLYILFSFSLPKTILNYISHTVYLNVLTEKITQKKDKNL